MRISDWSSDVCSSDLLDALLASLRAHDLEPDVLVPEPLLLPWHAGVAMVLVDANRALLRYGEARAFVGRPDELHMFAGSVTAGLDAVLLGDQQSLLPERNTRHVDVALYRSEEHTSAFQSQMRNS